MNPNQPQYQPGNQPPPAGRGRDLSFALSDVIVGGAALLLFIFSFTPIISVDLGSASGLGFNFPSVHQNLWSFDGPLGWWTAIADLLLLATAAAALVWPRDKEYVGFRRSQVQIAIVLWVFLILLGTLIAAGSSFGWGGYLMLLFAVVALAGAILGHLGMLQDRVNMPLPGGSAPATPAGYQPPAPGYAPGQAPAQQPHQGDTVA